MKKFVSLLAIIALVASASPALAFSWHQNSSDINVDVDNSAHVSNTVTTKADTGDNTANGGGANSKAKGKKADSDANGGNGGLIITGNALAVSEVVNAVNDNDIKVKTSCGCKGDIDVDIDNHARVTNNVTTKADTGDNTANGGYAKSKAEGKSSFSFRSFHSSNGGAESDADGGHGGDIATGDAGSSSSVMNIVNTNVVRIRR